MKLLSLSLFVGVCCTFALVTEGLPTDRRFKRQATTDNGTQTTDIKIPEITTSSVGTQSTPISSSSSAAPASSEPTRNTNNDFGLGAVAGLGGLTRGVGLGNFQIPNVLSSNSNTDPLSPWGAFAGLNLGNGGRIGAGCQGLSCGVQLGHFVLGTPQLIGLGRNAINSNQQAEGKKSPDETQSISETNFSPNPGSPSNVVAGNDEIRAIFRDAFRGFRETLASFFRAPVTHFIKKDRAFRIDNSTESVVGQVRSEPAASEPKTYRIQLTPPKPSGSEKGNEQENELD